MAQIMISGQSLSSKCLQPQNCHLCWLSPSAVLGRRGRDSSGLVFKSVFTSVGYALVLAAPGASQAPLSRHVLPLCLSYPCVTSWAQHPSLQAPCCRLPVQTVQQAKLGCFKSTNVEKWSQFFSSMIKTSFISGKYLDRRE